MNSYPTTRFGKIHVRTAQSKGRIHGETLCKRVAGDVASISFEGAIETQSTATCTTCRRVTVKLYAEAEKLWLSGSLDSLIGA